MVNEELQNRIKSALVLLKEGHSFRVGDLTLHCNDNTQFSVLGWTNNNLLENVTRQSALNELKDIKSLFSKMVDMSSELSQFIKDKKMEYCLGYDYGRGGIGICREEDGQIIWEVELSQ